MQQPPAGEMVVAVPSPPPSAAGRPHPTYKEMVLQALTELREPGGSSHRAISLYIADHFSGLPARHDALLSVHLRRLRSQGLLLMSGYSYLLPTTPRGPNTAAHPPGQKRGPGRPRKNADLASSAPFHGTKRGPGRPRKSAVPLNSSAPLPGLKRGPGRPPKTTTPVALAAPSGIKRGPGRPRKSVVTANSSAPLPGVKRGPGRPPKNTTPVARAPPSGVKRGPGRPRRNTIPMSVPHAAMPAGKRGRGRPRKNAPILTAAPGDVQGSPHSLTLVSIATTAVGKRRPGRPPKSAMSNNVTGVRRGRGRPPKVVPPTYRSIPFPAVPSLVAMTKRGPGRPRKERNLGEGHLKAGAEAQPQAADQAGSVQNGGHSPSSATSLSEKRGRGRPRKRPLETETTETGVDALVEKRGPGRPRKERNLGGGHLKAGVETKPQAADQAGSVPNGGESGHLPSGAASLTEKRGRGRPRKRPLETEATEAGVAVLVEKRGPGRPRKNNPSAPSSAETGDVTASGYKRGRGRPRKEVSIGTESAEAAVEVSRDLVETMPKEDTLVLGNKTETEIVVSMERMEATAADAAGVLVPGQKASSAHVEVEGAMLGVDPVDSNLSNMSL